MRKDRKSETISDWHAEVPRMRNDAMQYVPSELIDEVAALLSTSRLNAVAKDARRTRNRENQTARRQRRKAAFVEVRLAAAE
jgi:hypothetical protein